MFLIPGGTDIFGKCLEKYQEKKEERRASVDQSCGTDEENSNDGNEKSKKFATQIGDLSALDDPDLRNGEEEEEDSKSKIDFGGENIQSETLHKVKYQFNRSSRRKRGMSSNPLFVIQSNLAIRNGFIRNLLVLRNHFP